MEASKRPLLKEWSALMTGAWFSERGFAPSRGGAYLWLYIYSGEHCDLGGKAVGEHCDFQIENAGIPQRRGHCECPMYPCILNIGEEQCVLLRETAICMEKTRWWHRQHSRFHIKKTSLRWIGSTKLHCVLHIEESTAFAAWKRCGYPCISHIKKSTVICLHIPTFLHMEGGIWKEVHLRGRTLHLGGMICVFQGNDL